MFTLSLTSLNSKLINNQFSVKSLSQVILKGSNTLCSANVKKGKVFYSEALYIGKDISLL